MARLTTGVRGTIVTGVEFLGTLMLVVVGRGTLEVVTAKVGWFGMVGQGFRDRAVSGRR